MSWTVVASVSHIWALKNLNDYVAVDYVYDDYVDDTTWAAASAAANTWA